MKLYTKFLAAFCSVLFFIQSINPALALELKPQTLEISEPQFTLSDLQKASTIPNPQEVFKGESKNAVLLIQDAHSNPQAQTSIESIIQALHKEFGIKTLAVEGGTGEMDAFLLKACPSEEKVKQFLSELIQKGELSGIVPASVLSRSSIKVLGIENEEKYRIQLEKYLKASDLNKKNLPLLVNQTNEIENQKIKSYPKELLQFETLLNQFDKDPSQFFKLLKFFSEKTDLRKYKGLWSLQGQAEEEKDKPILEISALESALKGVALTSEQSKQFANEKQAFLTNQKSALEYATYLVNLNESSGLNVPISEDLKARMHSLEESRNIKAALFVEEIEAASEEVYSKYATSDELKNLRKADKEIRLAKKISSLEITDKEWSKVKDQSSNFNGVDLSAARSFYETANERDEIFSERLFELAKKETVMFVAGGFHTQAIANQLKKQNVSYVIYSPEASSESKNYDAIMRGNISWKSYLKPKNGKIDIYKSFSRMMIEKIAGKDWDFLMDWRRKIILILAEEGRLVEANKYTGLIDELAPAVMTEEKANELKEEWIKKLKNFSNDFPGSSLVSPSTVPAIFEKPLFQRSEIRADFHYSHGPEAGVSQRSEIRSAATQLDNFSIDVVQTGKKFWEGTSENFRKQAIYELCRKVTEIRREKYRREHQNNGKGISLVQPQFEVSPHELVQSDFKDVNMGSDDSKKTLASLLSYYEGRWIQADKKGELIDFLLKDLNLLRFERFREWSSDMADLSAYKIQKVSELLAFLAGDRSQGIQGHEWDESSLLFREKEPVNLVELVQKGFFRSRWYDQHISNGDFSDGVFHELGFRTGGLINQTRRHFYEMIALASIIRGLSREPHIFYDLLQKDTEPLDGKKNLLRDIQNFDSLDLDRKKQLALFFLEREEIKNDFQFREKHELISVEDLTTRLYGHVYLSQIKQIYYWQHLLNQGMSELKNRELTDANLQEEVITSFEDEEESGILKTYRLSPDQTHGYLIEVKDQKVIGFHELLIDEGVVASNEKLKLMKKDIPYDSNFGYEDWSRRIGKKVEENTAKPIVGSEEIFFSDIKAKEGPKGKAKSVTKHEWLFSIWSKEGYLIGMENPIRKEEYPDGLNTKMKSLRIGRFSQANDDGKIQEYQPFAIETWAEWQDVYFRVAEVNQISFYEYDGDKKEKKRLWSYRLNEEGLATSVDIFDLQGKPEKTIELKTAITEKELLSVEWLEKLKGDYRETLMPLAKEIVYWNDHEAPAFKLIVEEGKVKSVVRQIRFEAKQDFYKVDVLLDGELPKDLKGWSKLLANKEPFISSEATASKADERRKAITGKYEDYAKVIRKAIKVYSDYSKGQEIDIHVSEMKEVEDLFESFLFAGLSGIFGEGVLDYEKLMRSYQTAIGIAQNPRFTQNPEEALRLKNIFSNPAGYIPSDEIDADDVLAFVEAVLKKAVKPNIDVQTARSELRSLRAAIQEARNLKRESEIAQIQQARLRQIGLDPIKLGYNGENFSLLVSDYRNPAWQSALWLAAHLKDERELVEPIVEHDSVQALHHAYHEKLIPAPDIVNLQDNQTIQNSLIPSSMNNRGDFGWRTENLESYSHEQENQNKAGLVALLFSLNQKIGEEHNQEVVKILKQSLAVLKTGGRIAITLSPTRSFNQEGLEQLKALGVEVEKEGIGFNEFEDEYRNQKLTENGNDTEVKAIRAEDAIRRRQFYVLILKKKEEINLNAPTDKIVIDRIPFIEDPPEGKPGAKPNTLTLDQEEQNIQVEADKLKAAFIPRSDNDPDKIRRYKTFTPEAADVYQYRFHERRLKLIHKFRHLLLAAAQGEDTSYRDKLLSLLDKTYDPENASKNAKLNTPRDVWKVKRPIWNSDPANQFQHNFRDANGNFSLTIQYAKNGNISKIFKHTVNTQNEITYTQPLVLKKPDVRFDSSKTLDYWEEGKNELYEEVTDKRELRSRKEIYKAIDGMYAFLEKLFPVLKEHSNFGELFDDGVAQSLKEFRDGQSGFAAYFEEEDLEEIKGLITHSFALWESAARFFEKDEANTYLELRKLLKNYHNQFQSYGRVFGHGQPKQKKPEKPWARTANRHANFLEGIVSYLSAYSGAAYIKELLANPDFHLRLADLAAGSGALAHALKRQNVAGPDGDRFQYTEVDIEKEYLDQPRPEGYQAPPVNQIVGDVTELAKISEFQGKSLNLLTLFFILDLLKPADRKKLFIGMNQILEIEGEALLTVPQSWQLSEEFLEALKELGFEVSIPVRGRQKAKEEWLERIRAYYDSDPNWKDQAGDIVGQIRKMREKEFTILKIKKVSAIDPKSESIQKIEDENFNIQKTETGQRGHSDGSKPNNYDPKKIARWTEILKWVLDNWTEDDVEVFNPYQEDEIITKEEAIGLFPELETEKAMDVLYQYRFLFSPSQSAKGGNLHEKIANMKIYWEGSRQFFRKDILLLKELYHTGPPANDKHTQFKSFSVNDITETLTSRRGHYESLVRTNQKLRDRNGRAVNEIKNLQIKLAAYLHQMKQAHRYMNRLWEENSFERQVFDRLKGASRDNKQAMISVRDLRYLPKLAELIKPKDNEFLDAFASMLPLTIPPLEGDEEKGGNGDSSESTSPAESTGFDSNQQPPKPEGPLQTETVQKDIYAIVEKAVARFETEGRSVIGIQNDASKKEFDFPSFEEVLSYLKNNPERWNLHPDLEAFDLSEQGFFYEEIKLNYYRLAALVKIEGQLRQLLVGLSTEEKKVKHKKESMAHNILLKVRSQNDQSINQGIDVIYSHPNNGTIVETRQVSLGAFAYPFEHGSMRQRDSHYLGAFSNHTYLQTQGAILNLKPSAYNGGTRSVILTLDEPPGSLLQATQNFTVTSIERFIKSVNLSKDKETRLESYVEALKKQAALVSQLKFSSEAEKLFYGISSYPELHKKVFNLTGAGDELKTTIHGRENFFDPVGIESSDAPGTTPILSINDYYDWLSRLDSFLATLNKAGELPNKTIENLFKKDAQPIITYEEFQAMERMRASLLADGGEWGGKLKTLEFYLNLRAPYVRKQIFKSLLMEGLMGDGVYDRVKNNIKELQEWAKVFALPTIENTLEVYTIYPDAVPSFIRPSGVNYVMEGAMNQNQRWKKVENDLGPLLPIVEQSKISLAKSMNALEAAMENRANHKYIHEFLASHGAWPQEMIDFLIGMFVAAIEGRPEECPNINEALKNAQLTQMGVARVFQKYIKGIRNANIKKLDNKSKKLTDTFQAEIWRKFLETNFSGLTTYVLHEFLGDPSSLDSILKGSRDYFVSEKYSADARLKFNILLRGLKSASVFNPDLNTADVRKKISSFRSDLKMLFSVRSEIRSNALQELSPEQVKVFLAESNWQRLLGNFLLASDRKEKAVAMIARMLFALEALPDLKNEFQDKLLSLLDDSQKDIVLKWVQDAKAYKEILNKRKALQELAQAHSANFIKVKQAPSTAYLLFDNQDDRSIFNRLRQPGLEAKDLKTEDWNWISRFAEHYDEGAQELLSVFVANVRAQESMNLNTAQVVKMLSAKSRATILRNAYADPNFRERAKLLAAHLLALPDHLFLQNLGRPGLEAELAEIFGDDFEAIKVNAGEIILSEPLKNGITNLFWLPEKFKLQSQSDSLEQEQMKINYLVWKILKEPNSGIRTKYLEKLKTYCGDVKNAERRFSLVSLAVKIFQQTGKLHHQRVKEIAAIEGDLSERLRSGLKELLKNRIIADLALVNAKSPSIRALAIANIEKGMGAVPALRDRLGPDVGIIYDSYKGDGTRRPFMQDDLDKRKDQLETMAATDVNGIPSVAEVASYLEAILLFGTTAAAPETAEALIRRMGQLLAEMENAEELAEIMKASVFSWAGIASNIPQILDTVAEFGKKRIIKNILNAVKKAANAESIFLHRPAWLAVEILLKQSRKNISDVVREELYLIGFNLLYDPTFFHETTYLVFLNLAGQPPMNADWKKIQTKFFEGLTNSRSPILLKMNAFKSMLQNPVQAEAYQQLASPELEVLNSEFKDGKWSFERFLDGNPDSKKIYDEVIAEGQQRLKDASIQRDIHHVIRTAARAYQDFTEQRPEEFSDIIPFLFPIADFELHPVLKYYDFGEGSMLYKEMGKSFREIMQQPSRPQAVDSDPARAIAVMQARVNEKEWTMTPLEHETLENLTAAFLDADNGNRERAFETLKAYVYLGDEKTQWQRRLAVFLKLRRLLFERNIALEDFRGIMTLVHRDIYEPNHPVSEKNLRRALTIVKMLRESLEDPLLSRQEQFSATHIISQYGEVSLRKYKKYFAQLTEYFHSIAKGGDYLVGVMGLAKGSAYKPFINLTVLYEQLLKDNQNLQAPVDKWFLLKDIFNSEGDGLIPLQDRSSRKELFLETLKKGHPMIVRSGSVESLFGIENDLFVDEVVEIFLVSSRLSEIYKVADWLSVGFLLNKKGRTLGDIWTRVLDLKSDDEDWLRDFKRFLMQVASIYPSSSKEEPPPAFQIQISTEGELWKDLYDKVSNAIKTREQKTIQDHSIQRDIREVLRREIKEYENQFRKKPATFTDLEKSVFNFGQFKNHPILKNYETQKDGVLYKAVERNFNQVLSEPAISEDSSKLNDPKVAAQSFIDETKTNEKWKVTELEYKTIQELVVRYLDANSINQKKHLENLKQYVSRGDKWSVVARNYLVGTILPRLAALRNPNESQVKDLGRDYRDFIGGTTFVHNNGFFSTNLRDKFLEEYLLLELVESPFIDSGEQVLFSALSLAMQNRIEPSFASRYSYDTLFSSLPDTHVFKKYAIRSPKFALQVQGPSVTGNHAQDRLNGVVFFARQSYLDQNSKDSMDRLFAGVEDPNEFLDMFRAISEVSAENFYVGKRFYQAVEEFLSIPKNRSVFLKHITNYSALLEWVNLLIILEKEGFPSDRIYSELQKETIKSLSEEPMAARAWLQILTNLKARTAQVLVNGNTSKLPKKFEFFIEEFISLDQIDRPVYFFSMTGELSDAIKKRFAQLEDKGDRLSFARRLNRLFKALAIMQPNALKELKIETDASGNETTVYDRMASQARSEVRTAPGQDLAPQVIAFLAGGRVPSSSSPGPSLLRSAILALTRAQVARTALRIEKLRMEQWIAVAQLGEKIRSITNVNSRTSSEVVLIVNKAPDIASLSAALLANPDSKITVLWKTKEPKQEGEVLKRKIENFTQSQNIEIFVSGNNEQFKNQLRKTISKKTMVTVIASRGFKWADYEVCLGKAIRIEHALDPANPNYFAQQTTLLSRSPQAQSDPLFKQVGDGVGFFHFEDERISPEVISALAQVAFQASQLLARAA